jgi:hypothetical protein
MSGALIGNRESSAAGYDRTELSRCIPRKNELHDRDLS